MRRNCNLELRLLPSINPGDHRRNWMESKENEESGTEQQQLTIFYNGKVCSCDVTEIQARAIFSMVKDDKMEMEKEKSVSSSSNTGSASGSGSEVPTLSSQGRTGLSMKRSLQRFLQKRKRRVQAAFPY